MSDFKVFSYANKNKIFERDCSEIHISRPKFLDTIFHENGECAKHLKYFQLPSPSAFPLNLNIGSEQIRARLSTPFMPDLGKFQKHFIKANGRNLLKKTSKQQVFTTRNVLKSIMTFPYVKRQFYIEATKFGDIIYLANNFKNHNNPSSNEAHHFKFHKYCLSDSPHISPKVDEDYDESKTVYGLFRHRVNDQFELVYTAEVIGVESKEVIENFKHKETLEKWHFIVTKVVFGNRKNVFHLWFTLNTWIQCYLACVENIYVGTKTQSGFVRSKIECIKVQSLPNNQIWKPEICEGFLRDILVKIQAKMASIDCPYTVFEFQFDPEAEVIKYRVFEGKTEHSFLTDEFIQYMQKK